ncbi:DUF421 domain-containing protein [Bacillus salitolerans]|uniref:DUF421 domain-containing protein n=1 Tax=Bacillus salitolerans TaxID=1437434 RepID=A0ABW4LJZ8_9BACI
MDFLISGTEVIIGFFVLLITTKLLGKTQITQLTPFDFISALVLGELVGSAIHDKDVGAIKIIYVVFIWAVLIYVTELITQKFKNTRAFLEGKPSIVIHKGKINYEGLKKNKLDINQLQNLIRKKDVFSLKEVEYAILETDGTISVLKKSYFAPPTRNDLNLNEIQVNLPLAIVTDGEIVWDNLNESGFDEKWLRGQLQVHGCNRIKDCLYAEWTEGEALHVVKY